jgi:hypothetical protein
MTRFKSKKVLDMKFHAKLTTVTIIALYAAVVKIFFIYGGRVAILSGPQQAAYRALRGGCEDIP